MSATEKLVPLESDSAAQPDGPQRRRARRRVRPPAGRFRSVLFPDGDEAGTPQAACAPGVLADLNLAPIVADILSGREDYDLEGAFLRPVRDRAVIAYRQAIMADLETPAVAEPVRRFAAAMRAVRAHLRCAEKIHHKEPKEAWFVEAVDIYCDAVARLADDLAAAAPASRGLGLLCGHLDGYVRGARFVALRTETRALKDALSGVRYALQVGGDRVRVRADRGTRDYAADVAATFARFARAPEPHKAGAAADSADIDHVEAAILARVARLYPDVFAALDSFCRKHGDFCDAAVIRFDREIQFYLAYLEYIEPLRKAGLNFCYPRLSARTKAVAARETFDLALAARCDADGRAVVCNDFRLAGKERIFVVSGPNQGGKTTFARTFGQLHYLAALGCPVPGREARLYLFDRLFTHFEREEHVGNLRGKLEDDLLRIRAVLDAATPDSIVILNEIFSSTSLKDAIFLSKSILERIMRLDALGVCVTFIDELAALAEQTVSMVATVDAHDPAVRTYRIVRRPADGLAYAMAIARKHGLTYDALKARLPP